MKVSTRRRLVFTALFAVLCTIMCPSARGGTIYFTTTFTADDAQQGKDTFGPLPGNYAWVDSPTGDAYVPAWGISVPYAAETKSSSGFVGKLFPSGEVQVGSVTTEGKLEGDDNLKIKGEVDFSMTIQAAPNAPAPSVQILFIPTLTGGCKNEAWPPGWPAGSSTCKAEASASITNITTGATKSAVLPLVSGKGSNSIYPALAVNVSEGDTFLIDLTEGIELGGGVAACGSPGNEQLCGTLGSKALASVDPLFEFADPSSAKYYQFEFSPNIPITAATPEPSTLILFGTNLLIFTPLLRRRFGRN